MSNIHKDYFIKEDIPIYQNRDHFCFNTDTKCLASFIKVKKKETMLDICTNNGALLIWLDQFNIDKLIGVEVLKESYEIACMNAEAFIKHECILINQPIQSVEIDAVDVIVSNPPFFPKKETNEHTIMTMRQLGRIEENLTLEELISNAHRLLKSNGRFYFVHRPSRLNYIFYYLLKYNFHVKTLQMVVDHRDHEVKSVLIEAIKESNCQCNVLDSMII